MRIIRDWRDCPADARGAVLAVGNFDGLHKGHQEIIARARQQADTLDAPHGVLTFDPHTREFLFPDKPPFRLTLHGRMAQLLRQGGADVMAALPFNGEMASMSAAAFIDDVLVAGLGVRHVVVGENFKFGHKRSGDIETLKAASAVGKFGLTVLHLVDVDDETVSSTAIREHLQAGEVDDATALLGRYWEMEGEVLHGQKLGRTLDMPTANIAPGAQMYPKFGVYAIRACFDGSASQGQKNAWRDGVASFGIRPTIEGAEPVPLMESFLFDFDGDLYGKPMRVALVAYMRGEEKFDSLDALKAQMAQDGLDARQILASRPL